jgi:tRNA(Ile2) C34 agmatinyltransferase TiaS
MRLELKPHTSLEEVSKESPSKESPETATLNQLYETDAPVCRNCGSLMRRAGRCFSCPECGENEGCG